MNGAYRSATILFACATMALGVVIFVIGALHGGTEGLLSGVLFVAAGGRRLWMIRRRNG